MVNDLQAHFLLSWLGSAELAHNYSFPNYYINGTEGGGWAEDYLQNYE